MWNKKNGKILIKRVQGSLIGSFMSDYNQIAEYESEIIVGTKYLGKGFTYVLNKEGFLHSEFGVAEIENYSLDTYYNCYYLNGVKLKEDEWIKIISKKKYKLEKDGTTYYFNKAKLHRLDGPAIEAQNGKSYWIDGKNITEEEFKEMLGKKWEIVERERKIETGQGGMVTFEMEAR